MMNMESSSEPLAETEMVTVVPSSVGEWLLTTKVGPFSFERDSGSKRSFSFL